MVKTIMPKKRLVKIADLNPDDMSEKMTEDLEKDLNNRLLSRRHDKSDKKVSLNYHVPDHHRLQSHGRRTPSTNSLTR